MALHSILHPFLYLKQHRNKAMIAIGSGSGGNKRYWYQCVQLHVHTTDLLEGGRLMRTSSLLFLLIFKEWGCSICSLYIHISPSAELCSHLVASTKV